VAIPVGQHKIRERAADIDADRVLHPARRSLPGMALSCGRLNLAPLG
jgi:hypothetical protein